MNPDSAGETPSPHGWVSLFSQLLLSVSICTTIHESFVLLRKLFGGATPCRSAGFQTCCIADFQVGRALVIVRAAGLETRDTADLEVCATSVAALPR
jgi:hypothetical protein